MMKHYAGYLFDLDGTLVDTAPDINAALNHALTRAGLQQVDESLTRHWIGHGALVLVQQAIQHQHGPETAVPEVRQTFLEYYEAHIADRGGPYPGVVESLERLGRRGARLAVVTNKLSRHSVPLLEALNLAKLFHTVVGGDTAARPKPAADPALHACADMGVDVTKVLFVGDSEADVGCARAAGCDVVVVRDGYNHGVPAGELGADAVIDSFRDLV